MEGFRGLFRITYRLRYKILRVLLLLGRGTCRKRLLEHWLGRGSYNRKSERVRPIIYVYIYI